VTLNQWAVRSHECSDILRLLPETKVIAIVIGNSPNERFWVAEQQRILGPLLKNKVELIFYNERPFEAVLQEVAAPTFKFNRSF
jgi:hypothetical protein